MSDVKASEAPTGKRWTVHDRPPIDACGGACVVTANNGPVIDLGVSVEELPPFGSLCVAVSYVEEIALGLGMVRAAEVADVEARLFDAEDRAAACEAELDRVRAEGAEGDLALDVADIKAGVADIRAELERRRGGRPKATRTNEGA